MNYKKIMVLLGIVATVHSSYGAYRTLGGFAGPNSWTPQFSAALAEAAKTGYPILYIDVNSATCGHCHAFNELTLSSSDFYALERDIVFYQVMTDDASMSTSGTADLYNRYRQYYYEGSGYPLVVVIAKDGTVYGSFNRTVTDYRNVTADLRKLIEELSVKQIGKVVHTDGTEDVYETPATSSPTASPKPSMLEGWFALLKGKANGVVFDAGENVVGSLTFSCTAKGKVNVKVTSLNGNGKIKAALELDDNGNPLISAGGMRLVYDNDNGLWVGEKDGGKVFASKADAKQYDGLYTLAANDGAAPGYLTLTAKNGKGKASGMLNGRNKISANGVGIVLPASVVAANIPTWNCGENIAIYPVIKAATSVSGAFTVSANGVVRGRVRAVGADWVLSGGKWVDSTDLAPLNGLTVKVGAYEVPVVVAGASKIAAGANAYGAKVQAMVKKGTFKGSLKLPDGRLQFEGALIGSGSELHGVGVSYGAGVYKVTLGNADGCGECTVKE